MPDDKTTKAPETATPDTGPGKPPEQAPVKEPVKAEPLTPEQKPPEQAADKSTPPKGKVASTPEKAGAERGPKCFHLQLFGNYGREKGGGKRKNAG